MLDVHIWPPKAKASRPLVRTPAQDARLDAGVLGMPNENAEFLRNLEFNAPPRDIKFGAHGTKPNSTAAEAGQSRTGEANDSEDDWPGRERAKGLRKRVNGCINNNILNHFPPNKNSAHVGRGAISAPGFDPSSVEISPSRPLVQNTRTPEEEDTFALWQRKLEQDCEIGINWRRELAEAKLDEGSPLDDASFKYLTMPEGKLPRDMTREEVLGNWQDLSKAKIKEINVLYDLGCFQRHPRAKSHNIFYARWAIR